MLLKNPICYDNCKNCNKNINFNLIIQKLPLYEQNKKQKNVVLPIRKEMDTIEIKVKDMIYLVLNNKDLSTNYGNMSRNIKIKHRHNDKNVVCLTNRTNNSINNSFNKKPVLT